MYLQYLTTEKEKYLFMSIVYIVAISEPIEEDIGAEDPFIKFMIKVDGKRFIKDLVPNTFELGMFDGFAKELGIDLNTSMSGMAFLMPMQSYGSDDMGNLVYKLLRHEGDWYSGMAIYVANLLCHSNGFNLNNFSARTSFLSAALRGAFELYKDALSQEARCAILFESIAMALIDKNQSESEIHIIEELCSLLQLDRELIDEMRDVAVSFSNLYAKGLEIITE